MESKLKAVARGVNSLGSEELLQKKKHPLECALQCTKKSPLYNSWLDQ